MQRIQELARRDVRSREGEKYTFQYLSSWWSRYYNRPLKDPLLQQYTLEELAYEYYAVSETNVYQKELDNESTDKIEEEKLRQANEWADKMEDDEDDTEWTEEELAELDIPTPKASKQDEEWIKQNIDENELFFDEDLNLTFDE